MYVYICIYICMCVYMNMYMYIYIYTCTHVYVCIYICIYICMYILIFVDIWNFNHQNEFGDQFHPDTNYLEIDFARTQINKGLFSGSDKQLVGCDNGGGGGNFSKVKRLIQILCLTPKFLCFLQYQCGMLRKTFPQN